MDNRPLISSAARNDSEHEPVRLTSRKGSSPKGADVENDYDKPFEIRKIHVFAGILAIAFLAAGLVIIFISQKKIDELNNHPAAPQQYFTFSSIWDSSLSPRYTSLAWSAFDDTYITLDNTSNIVKVDPASGVASILVSASAIAGVNYYSFSFSADEKYVLFQTQHRPLYRHSSYDVYVVLNVATNDLIQLAGGAALRLAIFSPHATRHLITYVDGGNNLWLLDLDASEGRLKQITTDGQINSVINGVNDWVYEEEMNGETSAIYWNPSGDAFAWLRFNESQVPQYSFPLYYDPYNVEYTYKYPKAGYPNSLVSIGLYSISSAFTSPSLLQITDFSNYDPLQTLIGDVQWFSSSIIAVKLFPRFQNTSCIFAIDSSRQFSVQPLRCDWGQADLYIEPSHDFMVIPLRQLYADLTIDTTVMKNDFTYVGFFRTDSGNLVDWIPVPGARSILAWDNTNATLYFSASDPNSNYAEDLAIYGYSFVTRKTALLVKSVSGRSYQSASFSASGAWFVLNEMSAPMPSTWLYATSGADAPQATQQLSDNTKVLQSLQSLNLPNQVYVNFPSTVMPNISVNGYWLLPNKLDTSSCDKQVPVLVSVYGGPGDQQVTSNLVVKSGGTPGWHVFLASTHGMAIFVLDGVGTGGRGAAFQKSKTFLQLGVNEAIDVLSSVRDYVKTECWVDSNHIAIWGWSFGGFLTSMIAADSIQQRDKVFTAVMSVAPVTHWTLYDTIYTERYMRSPAVNADGYNISSLLNRANNLAVNNYIHIHGTGDDNVHVQNSFLWDNVLISAGQQYRSFYYPNRQHGLVDPITGAAPKHLYRMLTNYLAELGFLNLANEQTIGATWNPNGDFDSDGFVSTSAQSSLHEQWHPKSQRHGGLASLKRNAFHVQAKF